MGAIFQHIWNLYWVTKSIIGRSVLKYYKYILGRQVKNADMIGNDVDNAIDLGEPRVLHKGKMKRRCPTPPKMKEEFGSKN